MKNGVADRGNRNRCTVSCICVYGPSAPRKKRALRFYAVQLAMNALWPLLFLRLSAYLAAFVWLVLLIAAVCLCSLTFRYIRKEVLHNL